MVITGEAGGQIMGDWAQGEFQVAGQVAGTDYTCLPGLGVNEVIATGGDAFYFPLLDDAEKTAAQEVLASVMMSPETQVAFNLKKGSLPVRGDVDLAAANDCMKKGLEILADGQHRPGERRADQPGHQHADRRPDDRVLQRHPSITPEDAQARFAEIIAERRLTRRLTRAGPRPRAGAHRHVRHSGGKPHGGSSASQPAIPQPERQDRLDPDDPDGASSSSSAARSGRSSIPSPTRSSCRGCASSASSSTSGCGRTSAGWSRSRTWRSTASCR